MSNPTPRPPIKPPPVADGPWWNVKDTLPIGGLTLSGSYLGERYKERFRETFEAVDQILNLGVSKVVLTEVQGGPPAWTDGETITLNTRTLPLLDPKDSLTLATWMGVNYHELGHTLYSPRTSSPLWARIVAGGDSQPPHMHTVFNMVEDQRQERLLVAQFAPLRVYLAAAVAELIVNQTVYIPQRAAVNEMVWPLIAGRVWLPKQVRWHARHAFDTAVGAAVGRDVTAWIGEYQRLYDPAIQQADTAYNIIFELATALGGLRGLSQLTMCSRQGGDGVAMPHEGDEIVVYADEGDVGVAGADDELTTGSLDDLRKSLEEDEASRKDSDYNDPDAADDGDGDEGEGEGSDAAGMAGAEGDQGQSQGQQSEGQGQGNDSDTEGDDLDDGNAGRGAGVGKAKLKPMHTIEQVAGAIKSELRGLLVSEHDVVDEIARMRRTLTTPGTGSGVERYNGRLSSQVVSAEMRVAASQMIDTFRSFTDKALPHWDRRTDHGKLNVGRFLNAGSYMDYDTVFDRFEMGIQDELSLDVRIHVDVSSSMSGRQNQQAWEMAWVIRRAVQEADGDCTIVAFNTNSWEITGPDEKAHPEKWDGISAGGGTDPSGGLKASSEGLMASDARHKIVVLLTDGDWSAGKEALMEMNANGVITIAVLLLLQGDRTSVGAAQFFESVPAQYSMVASSPAEVVPLFEDVGHRVLAQAERDAQAWD